MVIAIITLQRLIQDSQDYGSSDEHMVSRVFFDMEVDGKKFAGLYADVKQSVGVSFETSPLEVSRPPSYKGPFNHEAFRAIVEQYYRGLVGAPALAFISRVVQTSVCATTHSSNPQSPNLKCKSQAARGKTPNPAAQRP